MIVRFHCDLITGFILTPCPSLPLLDSSLVFVEGQGERSIFTWPQIYPPPCPLTFPIISLYENYVYICVYGLTKTGEMYINTVAIRFQS